MLMTESELKDVPIVTNAKTSLETHSVEVTGDFGEQSPEAIAVELSKVLLKHGYSLSVEKQVPKAKAWADFKIAIPIALGFAVLFVILQKVGLVNLVSEGNVSYGTAFVIGIIASLSTCMAVVGGLLLSMSATFAKDPTSPRLRGARGDKVRPQL